MSQNKAPILDLVTKNGVKYQVKEFLTVLEARTINQSLYQGAALDIDPSLGENQNIKFDPNQLSVQEDTMIEITAVSINDSTEVLAAYHALNSVDGKEIADKCKQVSDGVIASPKKAKS